MRILQVITDTDRRGAQVFASDLDGALTQLGHEVVTVALEPGKGRARLPHECLGTRRLSIPTLHGLRRRAHTADVVIAHGSTTLPACALALPGVGVPFVYRQISESLFWAGRWDRRVRVRRALARATRVVSLAPSQARVLEREFGVPAERLDVVPNGIRADAFAPAGSSERDTLRRGFGIEPGAVVVAAVGALVPEKGTDRVVAALVDVADAQLLVAGDGPERGHLEAAAARLARPARFVGVLDEPRQAYAAADLLVLASRGGDSMPAALLEAGAMGLPCIATDVGAIGETIVDGSTGVVVGRSDDAGLASAVRSLVDEPERRSRMGDAARARVLECFDIGVVALGWERSLRAAVEARS